VERVLRYQQLNFFFSSSHVPCLYPKQQPDEDWNRGQHYIGDRDEEELFKVLLAGALIYYLKFVSFSVWT
jgi:hypothetical protein